MTDAKQLPALPVRDPGRALKIAEIHALATYFADNPDIPMPGKLYSVAFVEASAFVAYVVQLDGRIYGPADSPQFNQKPVPSAPWITSIIAAQPPRGEL